MSNHRKFNLNEKRKTIHGTWKQMIHIMTAIGIAVALFLLSKDKFIATIKSNPLNNFVVVVLLIVTIYWFAIYIYIMYTELGLLNEYLNASLAPRPDSPTFLRIAALGAGFGVMLAFTTNLFIYCATAVIFQFVNVFHTKNIIEEISEIIKQDTLASKKRKVGITYLYDYYVKKPLILRDSIILALFFITFVLSVLNTHIKEEWLRQLSYFLLIITIVSGEVIISRWRSHRNKRFYKLEKEIALTDRSKG